MALVTDELRKSQIEQDGMRTQSRKAQELYDREAAAVKIPTQREDKHSDSNHSLDGKDVDENDATSVKHLRFGIENILQQDSKKQKTAEDLRLRSLPGCFSQPFSSLHRGNVGTCYPFCQEVVFPWRDTGEEKSSNCHITRRVGHPYQNRTPPKRKKPRTSFSRLTIIELEKRFDRQKYLASSERTNLAKSLKISDSQVKTWFQNRRTKWRRQAAEEKELERQAASRLLHVASAISGFSSSASTFIYPEKQKDNRS